MVVRLLKGPLTVGDYHRMAEAGILGEDDRIELINGQLVEMTPIGPDHAADVDALNRLFSRVVGDAALVRVQNPIVLDSGSEPQPDLSLLKMRADGYRRGHPEPGEILLVIEVSDSSIDYDRDIKVPLYARAGIPEVWLVDIAAEQIEVYRRPTSEGYARPLLVRRGEFLSPVALPDAVVAVDEVLG